MLKLLEYEHIEIEMYRKKIIESQELIPQVPLAKRE
jgi:hypothetical protein